MVRAHGVVDKTLNLTETPEEHRHLPPHSWAEGHGFYRQPLLHFAMYLMADRYDVPALRQYSSQEFLRTGTLLFQSHRVDSMAWFSLMADLVYRAVPCSRPDDMMRKIFAHLPVQYFYKTHSNWAWRGLRPVMKKYPRLARDLLEQTIDHTKGNTTGAFL